MAVDSVLRSCCPVSSRSSLLERRWRAFLLPLPPDESPRSEAWCPGPGDACCSPEERRLSVSSRRWTRLVGVGAVAAGPDERTETARRG